MASIGTLWAVEQQPTGKRIRAVAAYAGLKLDIGAPYTHMETNKTEAFLSKFASGKIPAFEGKNGFTLFETKAIARYIAGLAPKAGLLGSTPEEAALVDQWVSFVDAEISTPMGVVLTILRNTSVVYNKPIEQNFRERYVKNLAVLEKTLHTCTYLVGERITLADITVASTLRSLFSMFMGAESRTKFPNCVRYFQTIANQPSMKDIWGPVEFAEKDIAYVPPPKDEKKKEAKPAAPPSEKKEKAKPKKEEEDDEDDDLVPKEAPKEKNPLDSLPKSEFNLEDWKRAYSNMDTRGKGGSIEWFDSKFDKEGFSIWRVNFKYNNELTQVFMSSNQIGGFFNRLEASRKYLFGSVGVLGSPNNSIITGVFILRGQDAKHVVDCAPDWESYEYEKISLEDKAQREFFEGALAWDLEVDGKKWADGKNFK